MNTQARIALVTGAAQGIGLACAQALAADGDKVILVDIKEQAVKDAGGLFVLATEPARTRGRFDFGASDLALRIRDAGMALSFDQGYWHTPPADAVFLHRKLGGLYLLAARLRAKVDVRAILEPHLTREVTRATA